MKIQVPALIGKIQTMADGGIRATHDYPELPPEEKTILFSLANKAVYEVIATEDEPVPEIPEKRPDIKSKKITKSQILRLAIEDLWARRGEKGDSEEFYQQTMDKIIQQINEKE